MQKGTVSGQVHTLSIPNTQDTFYWFTPIQYRNFSTFSYNTIVAWFFELKLSIYMYTDCKWLLVPLKHLVVQLYCLVSYSTWLLIPSCFRCPYQYMLNHLHNQTPGNHYCRNTHRNQWYFGSCGNFHCWCGIHQCLQENIHITLNIARIY